MPLIKGKLGAFLNALLALLTFGKSKGWFDQSGKPLPPGPGR